MAKGRMVSKDVSESDSFAKLSGSNSQLLCLLLTPWWDDHGKMIGEPLWIKGNIVRKLKQFNIKEIERCLKDIDSVTDVQWWKDESGNSWLYWPQFDKHQTISQEKKTKDKLPSPKIPKNPQENAVTREVEVEVEVKEEDKKKLKLSENQKSTPASSLLDSKDFLGKEKENQKKLGDLVSGLGKGIPK